MLLEWLWNKRSGSDGEERNIFSYLYLYIYRDTGYPKEEKKNYLDWNHERTSKTDDRNWKKIEIKSN